MIAKDIKNGKERGPKSLSSLVKSSEELDDL